MILNLCAKQKRILQKGVMQYGVIRCGGLCVRFPTEYGVICCGRIRQAVLWYGMQWDKSLY